jgi:AcrR family transcriptional regulator
VVDAPYLRIVADIQQRIVRGDLAPGDRAPSTRRITREWSVAMATATKVIATLRELGLVESRSGSGTFVRAPVSGAGPAGPGSPGGPGGPGTGPRSLEPSLSRDRLVRTAIAIADVEGLATLSMRRIAGRLGVSTMSMYRHVPSKDALTQLMADTVLGEEPLSAEPPAGWRRRLEQAARSMWTVFRRHPWAAEVVSMTRPQSMPHLLDYGEYTLTALRTAGFGVPDQMHIQLVLFGQVRALALNLQSEIRAQQDTGLDADAWVASPANDLHRLLTPDRYPALAAVAEAGFDFDLDAVFEYGLRCLLDGVEARRRAVTAARRPD